MPPWIRHQTNIFYWLDRQPTASTARVTLPFPFPSDSEVATTSIRSETVRHRQTRLKYWIDYQSIKPLSSAYSFLDFPRELRDEIYRLLYPIALPPFRDGIDITAELDKDGVWYWHHDWPSISFLLTCRTVYTEAIPFYYGHQGFYFTLPSSFDRDLVYDWVHLHSPLIWLNKIGSRNCEYIRHICINFEIDYTNRPPGSLNIYWPTTELVCRLIKRLPGLESLFLEFGGHGGPSDPPASILTATETLSKLKYLFASVMRQGLVENSPVAVVLKGRPALRNPCFRGIMEGRIKASYLEGPGSLPLYDGVAYSMPREQRVSKFWREVAPMKDLEIQDNSSTERITPLEIRAIQVSQTASLENLVLFFFTGGISSELAEALKGCVRSMEKLKYLTVVPGFSWGLESYQDPPPWYLDSSLFTCLPASMEYTLLLLRVPDQSTCESHYDTLISRCKRLKQIRYGYCDESGMLGDREPMRSAMVKSIRAGVKAQFLDGWNYAHYAKPLPESGTWCY